jgi:arylsulfatase A-like enzyme
MTGRRACTLVAMLLLALPGFGSGVRAAPRPNVVLITLDTTRADHLGCYGYARDTTPHLDRFAATAVRFANAASTINTTLASHAAMLTGLEPQSIPLPRNSFPLQPGIPTAAAILKKAGYRTAAFVSASALHSSMGLDRGFEVYDEEFGISEWDQEQRRAGDTTTAAAAWLDGQGKQPFFLWIHYFDPHFPYTPPEPFDRRFGDPYEGPLDGSLESLDTIWSRPSHLPPPSQEDLDHLVALYDGEIAYMDAQLAPVLERLDRADLRDRTLVVVTADHGESLTEHGVFFCHGRTLYQPNIHVPLLIRFPATLGIGPGEITPQVQTHDLLPTILSVAGLDRPARLDGVDLLPLIRGKVTELHPHLFAEASQPWDIEKTAPNRYQNRYKKQMVQIFPWKLILTPAESRLELYHLVDDPGETRNLTGVESERVERMLRLVRNWRKRAAGPAGAPDAANVQRLRSLGYVR